MLFDYGFAGRLLANFERLHGRPSISQASLGDLAHRAAPQHRGSLVMPDQAISLRSMQDSSLKPGHKSSQKEACGGSFRGIQSSQ